MTRRHLQRDNLHSLSMKGWSPLRMSSTWGFLNGSTQADNIHVKNDPLAFRFLLSENTSVPLFGISQNEPIP